MSSTRNRDGDGQTERRQITALFYDIVGSTKLSVRLDPEDMAALQASVHKACVAAVSRFDGHLERYVGDGGLALFGFPNAHEDDAERAIRAGFAILAGCEDLNRQAPVKDVELAVRIGIATGVVVASALVDGTFLDQFRVVGAPVNLAARLQASAAPDSILISSATRQLAGQFFRYGPLRPYALDGFDAPQMACQVLAIESAENRFAATRPHDLTPLISREADLERILSLAEKAERGSGAVLVISGEAGIGKSRLVMAALDRLPKDRFSRITLQCSSQHSETPLHPVVHYFERIAAIGPKTPFGEIVGRMKDLLGESGDNDARVADFLARVFLPASHAPAARPEVNAEVVRHKALALLVRRIEKQSRERPLVLVFEDVHWIDPTSRELLDLLVARVPGLPILVVMTARPDYEIRYPGAAAATELHLSSLSRDDCIAMVHHILGTADVPKETVEKIVDRADGIPLYVEELTMWLRGSDRGEDVVSRVPMSLSDSLIARLDRLGTEKGIVQIGSAIGRTFPVALLAKVAGISEAEATDVLERAVEFGLLGRAGATAGQYAFRHALLQEAAYEGMLRTRKRAAHQRIAEVLERDYAGSLAAAPEILASHYAAADMAPQAIRYFLEAGQAASARSANREAVNLLERALRLVDDIPRSISRDETELALRIALGPALIAIRGPGSPDVQDLYRQAIAICERIPQGAKHFPAYWGWWRSAPNFKEMHQRVDRLSAFAAQSDVDEFRLQAHHCQWATLFMLGRQRDCCDHIDKGLAIYDRGEFRMHGTLYGGHDPKVCGLGERALSLWLQGQADGSLRAIEAGLAHAQALQHTGSIAHAKDQQIMLLRYRRDAKAVAEMARDMLAFAEEHGFRDLAAKSRIFEGWAVAVLGDPQSGVRAIEDGLATQRRIGTQEDFPVYFEMLADAHRIAGQSERGLLLLNEALRMAEVTQLNYWTAELLRQTAELMLLTGDDAQARVALDKAEAIAREQGAHMLLLRATVSKARLLHRQGKRCDARRLIGSALTTITEGYDTADLKVATRLIQDCS